jgi:hypothetical protein
VHANAAGVLYWYIGRMNPAPDVHDLAADAEALSAEAGLPAELDGQPGTFRTASKVWAGITLLCLIMAVVDDEAFRILGITFGIVAFIVILVIGITDLFLPRARDRSTSDKALHAYFKCMKSGRWDTALAALAPTARERIVTVPQIFDLKTVVIAGTRDTKKELKAYWKTIICPQGALNRRLTKYTTTPLEKTGLVHRHRVEMRIDYYPNWVWVGILVGLIPVIVLMALTRKTYRTTFDVTTVKHKSQWWVLDGEFKGPLPGERYGVTNLPTARVV